MYPLMLCVVCLCIHTAVMWGGPLLLYVWGFYMVSKSQLPLPRHHLAKPPFLCNASLTLCYHVLIVLQLQQNWMFVVVCTATNNEGFPQTSDLISSKAVDQSQSYNWSIRPLYNALLFSLCLSELTTRWLRISATQHKPEYYAWFVCFIRLYNSISIYNHSGNKQPSFHLKRYLRFGLICYNIQIGLYKALGLLSTRQLLLVICTRAGVNLWLTDLKSWMHFLSSQFLLTISQSIVSHIFHSSLPLFLLLSRHRPIRGVHLKQTIAISWSSLFCSLLSYLCSPLRKWPLVLPACCNYSQPQPPPVLPPCARTSVSWPQTCKLSWVSPSCLLLPQ